MPESFGQLASLTVLDLSGSRRLTALPQSFGQLTSLTTLDLSENPTLTVLPESFGQLTALRKLDVSNCGLATANIFPECSTTLNMCTTSRPKTRQSGEEYFTCAVGGRPFLVRNVNVLAEAVEASIHSDWHMDSTALALSLRSEF